MFALYLCRLAWRFLSRSDRSPLMSLHLGSSQRNPLFLIMDAYVTCDGLVTCPGAFSASIPAATGWEAAEDPDEGSVAVDRTWVGERSGQPNDGFQWSPLELSCCAVSSGALCWIITASLQLWLQLGERSRRSLLFPLCFQLRWILNPFKISSYWKCKHLAQWNQSWLLSQHVFRWPPRDPVC